MATFDESMKSTADTTPPESTLNESKNETNVSDGLNQAYILEILQKNVPSGYKYCLTLVPRETGTLEKVLKNRNVSEKKNPATGEKAPKPTRHKISMHGEVITTEKYKKKISETQKKPATGAK